MLAVRLTYPLTARQEIAVSSLENLSLKKRAGKRLGLFPLNCQAAPPLTDTQESIQRVGTSSQFLSVSSF